MFAWWGRKAPPFADAEYTVISPTVVSQTNDIRQAISDMRLALIELEGRLDRLTKQAPAQSVDEYIADADTATRVYKALEPELGLDRRTILAKVERVVKAHQLDRQIPDWSTNVRLAKYLASRNEAGARRLVAALAQLEVAA
jgi:hypothetical protein